MMRMYYQVVSSLMRSGWRLPVHLPEEKSFKGGWFPELYNLPRISFIVLCILKSLESRISWARLQLERLYNICRGGKKNSWFFLNKKMQLILNMAQDPRIFYHQAGIFKSWSSTVWFVSFSVDALQTTSCSEHFLFWRMSFTLCVSQTSSQDFGIESTENIKCGCWVQSNGVRECGMRTGQCLYKMACIHVRMYFDP